MILVFSENENKFKNNEEDLTKFIKKSDQDLKDTLQEQLH